MVHLTMRTMKKGNRYKGQVTTFDSVGDLNTLNTGLTLFIFSIDREGGSLLKTNMVTLAINQFS